MAKSDSDKTTLSDSDDSPAPFATKSRPWSMAAAMEPLPPLAPPVDDPLPAKLRQSITPAHRREKHHSRLTPILFGLFLVAIAILLYLHYA